MTSKTVSRALTAFSAPTAGPSSPTTTPTPIELQDPENPPQFAPRFATIAAARQFSRTFFTHYNDNTPPLRHRVARPSRRPLRPRRRRQNKRQPVLNTAYASHPNRFRRPPQPQPSPPIAGSTNRRTTSQQPHASHQPMSRPADTYRPDSPRHWCLVGSTRADSPIAGVRIQRRP